MKLAFVLLHTQYYRHFDRSIRYLSSQGIQTEVVVEWIAKPNLTDRVLETSQTEVAGISFNVPIKRDDRWKKIIVFVRELTNYSCYFHPEHPSQKLSFRWNKYFSPRLWGILNQKWAINFLSSKFTQALLRSVEHIIPPDKDVFAWLRSTQPDVLVSSPFITARSYEIEYVKAAKAFGIPTVYALASWDNLTTKGTIHVQPDLVFVWNEAIKEEAITLHRVPRENVVVTGAPTFDYWFEMKPSVSREEYCQRVGIGEGQKYVVYLCSSRGMIEDETLFIRDLASSLWENAATRDLVLLVRPHPYNQLDLSQLKFEENVVVYPEQGDLPDVPKVKQVYYDTLYYASATVGVNTSAMLEAAIADVPCVTIVDERYRRSQTDMGHFRHLVNGGFLQITNSYEEAVEALAGILAGRDEKQDERRKFVREFIRPHGLELPVSELFGRAIEMAAERKSATEIMNAISTVEPVQHSIGSIVP